MVYLAVALVHYMMAYSLVGCMFALVVDTEEQALEVAHMLALVLACTQALELQMVYMLALLEGGADILGLLVAHKLALKLVLHQHHKLYYRQHLF